MLYHVGLTCLNARPLEKEDIDDLFAYLLMDVTSENDNLSRHNVSNYDLSSNNENK